MFQKKTHSAHVIADVMLSFIGAGAGCPSSAAGPLLSASAVPSAGAPTAAALEAGAGGDWSGFGGSTAVYGPGKEQVQ